MAGIGAFWRYSASATNATLHTAVAAHAARLQKRGLALCSFLSESSCAAMGCHENMGCGNTSYGPVPDPPPGVYVDHRCKFS